ncbi:MAG: class I SAM-dependent methyltransferase [Bacteroidales bacterium]|nr:class I SAM-dependent methyltransferase [Bacteroidales bacterium]
MSSDSFQFFPWYKGIFDKVGISLSEEMTLLDFGCGIGECVSQFRGEGYNAYGCDIDFPENKKSPLKECMDDGYIRKIEYAKDSNDTLDDFMKNGKLSKDKGFSYHLPFDDDTFDIIFSNQVFEHIMDYPTVLAELQRVTKPEGINLHVFPGRWRVRESHVYVPFSSVIRFKWYLLLAALFGIRNEFQQGMSAKEVANRNYWYLHECTLYPNRRRILQQVKKYFDEYRFEEEAYFYVKPGVWKWFNRFPILLRLYRAWYSDTQMRLLIFGKKKEIG